MWPRKNNRELRRCYVLIYDAKVFFATKRTLATYGERVVCTFQSTLYKLV